MLSRNEVVEELKGLISIKFPIIMISTEEERRAENLLMQVWRYFFDKSSLYFWDSVNGLKKGDKSVDGIVSLEDSLRWLVKDRGEKEIYIFKDIHRFLNDSTIIRLLKNVYDVLKGSSRTLFLIAPPLQIPDELYQEISVVNLPLPGREEVGIIFDKIIDSLPNGEAIKKDLSPDLREQFIRAALGLGAEDIFWALKKSLVGIEKLTEEEVKKVFYEKKSLVKKTGILEFVDNDVTLDDLGGLENLKTWLKKRKHIFSKRASKYGLNVPKGILVMGISGCGKSMAIKAIASYWNFPLLRLDMARLYDMVFGPPEQSLEYAIKTAEAVAPVVLWVDEIEGGLANKRMKSQATSESRVLASFLTWMQEKKRPVFVGATANEIDLLPPEMLRKGRFDEIFYVDLPNFEDRKKILSIHLSKRNIDPSNFNLNEIAKSMEGFNGAEIEQVVISALVEAFSQERELTDMDIFRVMGNMVPLSTTMKEEIKRLERWAYNRAVKASGSF